MTDPEGAKERREAEMEHLAPRKSIIMVKKLETIVFLI